MNKTILIVDDDNDICKLISYNLLDLGYETQILSTGKDLIDYLMVETPHLLVLDYSLPDMDAPEVIQTAKKHGFIIPPFIVSTGRGDEAIAVNMMKLGARDYVVKDAVFIQVLCNAVTRLSNELEKEQNLETTKKMLKETKALLVEIFNQSPSAICIVTSSGNISFANNKFYEHHKIPLDTKISDINILQNKICIESGLTALIKPAFGGAICKEYNCSYRYTDSETNPAYYNINAFPVTENEIIKIVILFEDNVTEHYLAQQKAEHLSLFDPLTNLANRNHFFTQIENRISWLKRYGSQDALLLLNLDRFKIINDVHGNLIGDRILIETGLRLKKALRETDFLGRTAADEFAIILPASEDYTEKDTNNFEALKIMTAAERLREIFLEPFIVDEQENIQITASIGITFFPLENDTPQSVFSRASTTVHRIKTSGKNQSAFFEKDMSLSVKEKYTLERDLLVATKNGSKGGLTLFLQAQVDSDKNILGAECLIRWIHPERGMLAPGVFIPLAEESDLIIKIGEWVLEQACILLNQITKTKPDLKLSVNISPRHFMNPDFCPWIFSLLSTYHIPTSKIILEITEGLFINKPDQAAQKMQELVNQGFLFSIDDFGTGYSSLSYLKKLPLHELKIDKTFVQDAPNDLSDAALVDSIIAVAKTLGLQLVAEGVETQEQVQFLEQRASMTYQGYLFGKPVSASDFISNL